MAPDGTGPLTTAAALAAGITYDQLRGPGFVAAHRRRGIWLPAGRTPPLATLLMADRLILPPEAALSHKSGLAMYGIEAPGPIRRHWTTVTQAHPQQSGIVIHRRAQLGEVRIIDGARVLSPARCLADVAPSVSLRWLVSAGDELIHTNATSVGDIRLFARQRIHGAKRLRIAASLMREGSKSFRESGTRLIFHCAGMPEPRLNLDLYDDGDHVACNDFAWREWNSVAEYDGWYHERDKAQRNYDLRRADRIRHLGVNLVVLTSYDYDRPAHLSRLVWAKLAQGGYDGPRPEFDWDRWRELTRIPRRGESPAPPPF